MSESKAGWEVEGFIDRLTRRDDSNSERLVLEAISHLRAFSRDCEALRESNERMEKSLHDIEAWARAYPLTVFPEPDMKKAAEVLRMHGMTVDAISASAMRHVLDGIINIVRDGLGGTDV